MPANVDMLVRMKLLNAAAVEVTSAMGQGISTLVEFAEMDKEGIELVFRQLARPGGVDAAGNRNPGIKISAVSQLNFGLMCYYVKHKQDRVDRTITFANVTLVAVKKLKTQQLLEMNHKDPTIVLTSTLRIGQRRWTCWISG